MNNRLFSDTVRVLSQLLDYDEGVKLDHAWRVGLLSYRIAVELGLPAPQHAYFAGLLHDIGGLGLPDHLVHHAARGFTDSRAREHAHAGERILAPFSLFAPWLATIRDHHERFDGEGFPDRRRGGELEFVAGVLHLADHLEVVMRGLPDHLRLAQAVSECRKAAGTRVEPAIAETCGRLLQRDPELLVRLYDPPRLAEELEHLELPAPRDDQHSEASTMSQLLWLLARVVDAKHPYTMGHSTRVAFWSFQIARELPGVRLNLWDVVWAGLLHDVGKVAVPRSLLDKRTPLTGEQWELLKDHARQTMRLIEKIHGLEHLAYPAAAHHERYAGGGYPLGGAGESIPLIGRILAYADAYDAMTSDRGYNVPLTHDQALENLRSNVGAQFDPRLAPTALRVLARVPVTSLERVETMGGFADFFRKQEADFLSLVESGDTSSALHDSEAGVALLHADAWHRVLVDAQLRIVEGKPALIAAVMNFNSDHLPDFLDSREHDGLRRLLAEARGPEPVTLFVRSAAGLPLELVVVGARPEGSETVELFFRCAEREVHSARQLAMVYRNFTSSSDAVVFMNAEGSILDVNERFEGLAGAPRNLLLGRSLSPFVEPEVWSGLHGRERFSGETRICRTDGVCVPVDAALVELTDAAGRSVGFMLRASDITERKEAEARLRTLTAELERKNLELERLNRLKGDLMAVTSHDLKSPLAAMITSARFLLEFPDREPARLRTGLTRIVDSGEYLLRFIQDLLDLERMEAGAFVLEREVVSCTALVSEVVATVALHAAERTIRVEQDPIGEDPRCLADPRRLRQVFHNLLSNAVKFSPDGATVRVSLHTADGRVRVRIADRGPGIPEDQREAIFDRYHQVKGQGVDARGFAGAGLGLFIVRKILELHEGRVWVECPPDGGSDFFVELAATAEPAGLRVWLLDPEDRLHPQLAPSLAGRGVRLGRLDDAAQLAALPAADALFIHGPALPASLDRTLGDLAARVPIVIVDGAGREAFGHPGIRVWEEPILAAEVAAFLRETRLNRRR